MGEGGEENRGGCRGGCGRREGKETSDVRKEVGREDQLLLATFVVLAFLVVNLGSVETDQVTVLVRSVDPILKRITGDFGSDPFLRS